MKSEKDRIAVVEISRKDAYLKEIRSKYVLYDYYDVILFRMSGSWRIELIRKALGRKIDKEYHGKLFEDHIEEPKVFAAEFGGDEIGWVELGYEKWNNRMRVWEFLVEEEYRGRGAGKLLMNHAVKIAREKGARMLTLETQTNNGSAIDFYINFGFELVGVDTAAYSNQDIEKKEVRLELGLKL